MPVICTTFARHSPIPAPISMATASRARPAPAMSRAAVAMVAPSAITMPAMPATMPERDVWCLDRPARLTMNSNAATM